MVVSAGLEANQRLRHDTYDTFIHIGRIRADTHTHVRERWIWVEVS